MNSELTDTPHVQPLSRNHRRFAFGLSLFLFVTLVPLLVFYAIGYRFDFSEGGVRNIQSVGGMYISTDAADTQIFVDDEPVENMRIFQQAAYIQNLEAGIHQVHVQGEGVATWVKRLPVFSHFVTEAASFNMPLVPHVRYVTEFVTADGAPVVSATATVPFAYATTTQIFVVATSTPATSTYEINPEFTYISKRFASSTEERTALSEVKAYASELFTFTTTPHPVATTAATTTVQQNDMMLFERADTLYARWIGQLRQIPYYFCVNPVASSTASIYGQHVTDQLRAAAATALAGESVEAPLFEISNRVCRSEIAIDTQGETPLWFSFLPTSRDHVLLQLSDGLYVTEIDDRAWQNSQLLFPGNNFTTLVDGNSIFVDVDGAYLEVYTTR